MGQKGSKDRLSKADIEMLKTSTRYDEATIREWYRGFKADCPDGRLTPKAFMTIYSKCFPTGNANDFCDHVFRTFDTDKNGFIDFKEFLLAIDVTSSGCPEEKLNWAFRYVRFFNNYFQYSCIGTVMKLCNFSHNFAFRILLEMRTKICKAYATYYTSLF